MYLANNVIHMVTSNKTYTIRLYKGGHPSMVVRCVLKIMDDLVYSFGVMHR